MKLTDGQRTELTKAIRRTMNNSEGRSWKDHADAVAPLVESWLREAQAAAWDKGFDAGELDAIEHERIGDWDSECIRNPYRERE